MQYVSFIRLKIRAKKSDKVRERKRKREKCASSSLHVCFVKKVKQEKRTALRAAQRTTVDVRLWEFFALNVCSASCLIDIVHIAANVSYRSEYSVASFSLTKPFRMRISLWNVIEHVLIRRYARSCHHFRSTVGTRFVSGRQMRAKIEMR